MREIQIKLALNCFDFSLFDAIKKFHRPNKAYLYHGCIINYLCLYISCIQHDTVGFPVHNYISLYIFVFRKFQFNENIKTQERY